MDFIVEFANIDIRYCDHIHPSVHPSGLHPPSPLPAALLPFPKLSPSCFGVSFLKSRFPTWKELFFFSSESDLFCLAWPSLVTYLKCHHFVLINVHYIQTPRFLYLFLCWRTACPSACLGSCEQYCSKHGCGSSSVQGWHGFLQVWIQVENKAVLFQVL